MDNITINVISNNKNKQIQARKGDNLLKTLIANGILINAPCGGKGTCGKCKVKLLSGNIDANLDKDKNFLSCKAKISENITIQVNELKGSGLTESTALDIKADIGQGYGIALDIGTTTLAFYLYDLATAQCLSQESCLNPETVFGADVISRINACENGHLPDLNKLIVDSVNNVINQFIDKYELDKISKMCVCGNTTMLHIFYNADPSSIGKYPFTAKFLGTQRCEGKKLGIDADEIILLPNISSYVGSDITAGMLSTKIVKGNNILLDIGTNGEMVICANGKLYCTSTAAGPAFEGANIECGMGGVDGAINKVEVIDGKIKINVISGKPKGICGCGLIDAISVMLELEIIDESGAFNGDEDKFYLTDKVYISQKDIREFQLAKSAIRAGLLVLIARSGLKMEEIEHLYIAGGLGFYINKINAINIGLIPKELQDKIVVVGNSGGNGTKMALLSNKKLDKCTTLANSCSTIDLATDELFMDEYINGMMFEQE